MRTFSLVEGTSDKFWSIDVVDASVTVNYGRTGTNGQTKTTQYDSAAKATAEAEKLIASKVRKGYVEGTATGTLTPVTPTVSAHKAPVIDAAPQASTTPTATPPATSSDTPIAVPAPPWDTPDELTITPTALEEALMRGEPFPLNRLDEPFDPAPLRAWLQRNTIEVDQYRHTLVFLSLPFEGVPSAPAAAWWLQFARKRRMSSNSGHYSTPTLRERLDFADADYASGPGDLSASWDAYDLPPSLLVGSLLAFLEPRQVLTFLLPGRSLMHDGWEDLLPVLRASVTPWLAPHDRVVPPIPEPSYSPQLRPREWRTVTQLLASAILFGNQEAIIAAYEEALAAPVQPPTSGLTLAAVSGISDPQERLRRLQGVDLGYDPATARGTVIFGGRRAIPLVVAGLDQEFMDKPRVAGVVRLLGATATGPGLVSTMLGLTGHLRAKSEAVAWLASHPQELANSSATPTAAQRDTLTAIVRDAIAQNPDVYGPAPANPALVSILAELAAEAALPTLDADAAPAWFREALAREEALPVEEGGLKIPTKTPTWAQPSALPPLVVAGARLDAALTTAVLASAARGANVTTRTPRPLVAAVRDHMTGKDRDAFAVPLLQAYLTSGAKPADRAYFVAAGYLGAEGLAFALAPLVREWPGQSQHQRAVLGLEVLAATGTTAALQAISGIANKSKFKGVQKAAQEALAKLAALQGLTVDQLEDRVVPDADLDAHGVRVLTYGPRSFRVSLSPQGKAVVRDLGPDGRPTGKPRTALPAPNSRDDADAAALAKAEFAVLRKQLTEVSKIQTARLEKALVTGRTWSAEEHRTLVAQHPVLNALIRPLVWQVSSAGHPRALVRVSEDHEYLDVAEDTVTLPDDATLALAHPLNLSEAERDAWRAHLVDFDLVAPLDQLDRPVFGLPAGQTGITLAGLPTGLFNPGTLVSTLERHGWRRGTPADAGVVHYLWLPFESLGLAVALGIDDGLWTGMILESGDQKLDRALLGPLKQVESLRYLDDRGVDWQPWESAPPVLVSEVRRSLAALEEKMA